MPAWRRNLKKKSNYSHIADSSAPDAHLPLTRTNEFVVMNQAETNMFATIFAGVLDPKTGVIRYVNCGHNPPYVVTQDHRIRAEIKLTGPVLGQLPGVKYTVKEETLQPGETLFIYTDGLPEAHNPQGELWTNGCLEKTLQQPTASAADILKRVEDGFRAHIGTADQFDDITILVIRRELPHIA